MSFDHHTRCSYWKTLLFHQKLSRWLNLYHSVIKLKFGNNFILWVCFWDTNIRATREDPVQNYHLVGTLSSRSVLCGNQLALLVSILFKCPIHSNCSVHTVQILYHTEFGVERKALFKINSIIIESELQRSINMLICLVFISVGVMTL